MLHSALYFSHRQVFRRHSSQLRVRLATWNGLWWAAVEMPEEAVAVAALVVLRVLQVLPPQVTLLLQAALAAEEDSPAAVAVVAAQPVLTVAPRTPRRSVPA
jgi:hypothetical protein